jgi:hypothetical protein
VIGQGIPIYVALEPVDMRMGYERLGGLLRERTRAEPRSKALFVFVGGQRAHRRPLNPPQQENRVLIPIVTGELHRPQARFSPVNFTEYPRFLMPATTGSWPATLATLGARSRRTRRPIPCRRPHLPSMQASVVTGSAPFTAADVGARSRIFDRTI